MHTQACANTLQVDSDACLFVSTKNPHEDMMYQKRDARPSGLVLCLVFIYLFIYLFLFYFIFFFFIRMSFKREDEHLHDNRLRSGGSPRE